MSRLYYWDYPNFGDQLSRYLVSKITEREVEYSPPPFEAVTLLAIGSMINLSVLRKNICIWGTGTLHTKILDYPSLKMFPVNRLVRQLREQLKEWSHVEQPKIYAVRGPRTRALLINKGFYCPEVFGDPAILLPKYYVPKNTLVRYSAGLILHHTQKLTNEQIAVCNEIGIRPISIFRKSDNEIESFVDEVCSCEKVFSSSLHGVIVAQAYGIPAQWIQLKNRAIHADAWHKFEDYFLGAGQENQEPLQMDLKRDDINWLLKLNPPKVRPFVNADTLADSFPDIEF